MFYISLAIVVIALLFLLYVNIKIKQKSSLMRDNQLLQSEATSSLICKLERQESSEQEARLMTNARYRAMKTLLNLQIKHFKSLSLVQIQESFKDSKVTKHKIHHEDYVFVLKVEFHPAATRPSLQVIVKPNTLFGALFAVEEWIQF